MKNWVSYDLFTHLCSLPDSKTIPTISQLFLTFSLKFSQPLLIKKICLRMLPKEKRTSEKSSVWNFSSSNLLTSSTGPGKHSLLKYRISQSRTGSAFLIITRLRSTQALYLHGQVQGQLFAQIFPFSPAKQFSTAMPWRDLRRNLCVIGSFTSKSILMQKKPEVHCWSSLEEFLLSVLIWSFF